MAELFEEVGYLQDHGGVMLAVVLLIIELRKLRRDFNRHSHDEEGRPVLGLYE